MENSIRFKICWIKLCIIHSLIEIERSCVSDEIVRKLGPLKARITRISKDYSSVKA